MRLPTPVRTLLFVALAVGSPTAWETRAQPAQPEGTPATKPAAVPAAGDQRSLPNFGVVVSDWLYRGAQPTDAGFAELKKLGVEIVVNLRNEIDQIARERTLVEAQGVQYVSIPWRGKEDPKTEQVAQFLDLLRDNPKRKVFVHCERGAERTGVMVACYRISREHWTAERALTEMEAYHFRGLRFGHLKRFVREFPALLRRDPLLRDIDRGH